MGGVARRPAAGLGARCWGLWLAGLEEWFAVVAAEQEGEAVQVHAQLADSVGGAADEVFQGGGSPATSPGTCAKPSPNSPSPTRTSPSPATPSLPPSAPPRPKPKTAANITARACPSTATATCSPE